MHCLSRNWRESTKPKAATAFAVTWNMVAWGSLFISSGKPLTVKGVSYHSLSEAFKAEPITGVILIFPLIGLLMLYHSVAMWVNKTEVKISSGELVITQGPLYWYPSEIKVPMKDIKEAYVQEYSPYSENKERIIRYRLVLQRYSSEDIVGESGIALYSDAEKLEKWLEAHMRTEVEMKKAA